MRELRFFVIAGENSGDMHGANLLRAIQRMHPAATFVGLGGERLRDAGMKLVSNIVNDLAIIGIIGVVTNFPRIRRLFNRVVAHLRDDRPRYDAIILIDYAGFNIRIAEQAKKLGVPVIWYISPQIWAWHGSRKYILAERVAKMIVIFPFEESIYRELDMDVEYVGHPLFDVIKIDQTREEVYAQYGLDPARPLVTIVPGSRKSEVESFLSIMLEGARRFHEMRPDCQFAVIRATTIPEEAVRERIARADLPFEIPVVDRFRLNLRKHCTFSWVKSGTSTLEAAILGTPMLIVYRVNSLTWMIGKQLFTIGFIGLPNIVAGDRIVPELLQEEFTPRNLAEKTRYYFDHSDEYARMARDLDKVREKLGGPGASERAARACLDAVGIKLGEDAARNGVADAQGLAAPGKANSSA